MTELSPLERAARAACQTYMDIEGHRLTWDDLRADSQYAWMEVASAAIRAHEGGGK